MTRRANRAGYTLVEMMIALAISASVLYTITLAVSTASGTYRTSMATMDIETRGARAMRRIVATLRGTDADLIAAVPAPPLSTSSILFQDFEAFNGVVSEPGPARRLALQGGSVVWTEDVGTADEHSVTWADGVPDYLDGETLDNTDENGNGLIDEAGLCFARERSSILVSLTLQDDTGRVRTWRTRVACRN